LLPQIRIAVEVGNALEMRADVLVLKHAQGLYGADRAAFECFQRIGIDLEGRLPGPSSCLLLKSGSAVEADKVLFVGAPTLDHFSYEQIRDFAYRALATLAREAPETRDVLLTLHGPGYGLDEIEAFESEIAGILDAWKLRDIPPALERITILERNTGRARRLQASLQRLLPRGVIQDHSLAPLLSSSAAESLRTAGATRKPLIFVAMPFDQEFDDRFHYGIQGAVNDAGFLCERADMSSFTGDVMARVKAKIDAASLVIAELSSANPNVYLEVGYAWGCGKPTVLVVCDESDLQFNVRGQRCLVYGKSIKRLEGLLRNELQNLRVGI